MKREPKKSRRPPSDKSKKQKQRDRQHRRLKHVYVVDGKVTHLPSVPGLTKDNVPFMGELMICHFCGRKQRSHPLVESGWYCIQADGERHYICPDCLSPSVKPA